MFFVPKVLVEVLMEDRLVFMSSLVNKSLFLNRLKVTNRSLLLNQRYNINELHIAPGLMQKQIFLNFL